MIISFSELPLSEVYKVQFIYTVAIKLKQVSQCPYAQDPSVTVLVYYIFCCAKTFVFSPSLTTKLHFATTSLCSQRVTSFLAETRDDLNKTLKR